MLQKVLQIGILSLALPGCNLFSSRERDEEPPKTTTEKKKEVPPTGIIGNPEERKQSPEPEGERRAEIDDEARGNVPEERRTEAPQDLVTGKELRVSLLPSRTGKGKSLFQNCLEIGLGQNAPKKLCNNDASLNGKPVVWNLPAGDATNYVWFQVKVSKPTAETMQNCIKGTNPCNFDAGATMLPSPRDAVVQTGEKSVPSRFCIEEATSTGDVTKKFIVYFEDNTDFDYDDMNFSIEVAGQSKVVLTSFLTYEIKPTATGGCPKAPGAQRDIVVKALTPDSR